MVLDFVLNALAYAIIIGIQHIFAILTFIVVLGGLIAVPWMGPPVVIGEMIAKINFIIAQLTPPRGGKLWWGEDGEYEYRRLDDGEPVRNRTSFAFGPFGIDYDRDPETLGDGVEVVDEDETPMQAASETFAEQHERISRERQQEAAADGGTPGVVPQLPTFTAESAAEKIPVDIEPEDGYKTFYDPGDSGAVIRVHKVLSRYRDAAGLGPASDAEEGSVIENSGGRDMPWWADAGIMIGLGAFGVLFGVIMFL